jgi:hypothetical protein
MSCTLTNAICLQVSPELLAQCVSQAAASGYSSSTDSSLLRDGLAVMAGAWPLNRWGLTG